ncbi:hypothetical protein TNCV_2722631 [Trichonephila clavipes]|nr:hypothetical protein TNCV_2722631 [Trichonephila clavipes]
MVLRSCSGVFARVMIISTKTPVTAPRRKRYNVPDDIRRVMHSTTVSKQTLNRRLGHTGLYAHRLLRGVQLTATHCHQ